MEYELGGQCEVVETEQYLIKFIIRMDMKAVIQIIPVKNTPDSLTYGKFLLQTMQFLLQ